jgi:hypothetical protein
LRAKKKVCHKLGGRRQLSGKVQKDIILRKASKWKENKNNNN